jgi:ABC-2 type transport system permease protein
MVIRELKSVKKEKTILFAVMIQFFIASLSSILVVGLMTFYDPDSIGYNGNIRVHVGVIGDDRSPFISFLRGRNIRPIPFADIDKAEQAFKAGDIDTIVYLPEVKSDVVEMKLVLPDMDSRATIALMALKGPLKQYENYLRQQRGIQVRYSDMGGKPATTYEFLYTIIIPILMFFPAFVAGSMIIDSISEEIEQKTLATLLAAPVSLNRVLTAKILAAVILAIVQCVLWVFLLRLNNFTIQNLVPVLLFAIIIAAIVALSSMLIAVLFRDRERSQFVFSVMIVVAMGFSFLLDPSPFGMIARLATGDSLLNPSHIFLYLAPLMLLITAFPFLSKRSAQKMV